MSEDEDPDDDHQEWHDIVNHAAEVINKADQDHLDRSIEFNIQLLERCKQGRPISFGKPRKLEVPYGYHN